MEVHHHPHVEKKSFKEYILEGLMIFMAVTMGFIAENIRENISENHKSQELAESLYKEVTADSIVMQQKIQLRNRKVKQMAYFRNMLRDSSLDNLGSRFGMAMYWTNQVVSVILFEPQDGILSQLKNSNNFKFYRTTELQNAVGKYAVAMNRIRMRNQQEYNVVDNFLRNASVRYFDFRWLEKVSDDGKLMATQMVDLNPLPEFPFEIQNKSQLNRAELAGIVSQYLYVVRGTSQLHYQDYMNANHQLLEALRKDYHLNGE